MPFCPRCGVGRKVTAKFCNVCGYRFKDKNLPKFRNLNFYFEKLFVSFLILLLISVFSFGIVNYYNLRQSYPGSVTEKEELTTDISNITTPEVTLPTQKETTPENETKKTEETLPPKVSTSEVLQLGNKFELYKLKDGATLELRISESYGEVFSIYKQSGTISVSEMETQEKDVLIWISRKGFYEIINSNDPFAKAKELAMRGQISFTTYKSEWTLYRKGYKSLYDRLT